jgi:hypothetical protein
MIATNEGSVISKIRTTFTVGPGVGVCDRDAVGDGVWDRDRDAVGICDGSGVSRSHEPEEPYELGEENPPVEGENELSSPPDDFEIERLGLRVTSIVRHE